MSIYASSATSKTKPKQSQNKANSKPIKANQTQYKPNTNPKQDLQKKSVIKSFWIDKSPSLLYNVNRLNRQGDIL